MQIDYIKFLKIIKISFLFGQNFKITADYFTVMTQEPGLPSKLTVAYGKEIKIYQHHWGQGDLVKLAYGGGEQAISFLPEHHRILFDKDVQRLAHEGQYQGEYFLGQVDSLEVLATNTFYGMFKRLSRNDEAITEQAVRAQMRIWAEAYPDDPLMRGFSEVLQGDHKPVGEMLLGMEDVTNEMREYFALFIKLLHDNKYAVSLPILEYFAERGVIKGLLNKRGDDQILILEQMTNLNGDFYDPAKWRDALSNFRDAHHSAE